MFKYILQKLLLHLGLGFLGTDSEYRSSEERQCICISADHGTDTYVLSCDR